jgi:tol-pal system protein YbgF
VSRLVRILGGALVLTGCASKGDVQTVQGEVALLKAEMARRDSTRAAQLTDVIKMQMAAMDSITATRRAVAQLKGELSPDLYNIQQQLVQLQELTGQSQQRLSEMKTRLEARGAQMETEPGLGETAGPISTGAAPSGNATADQMYEASLAQLRRGNLTTARLGLREMLRTYPTSERAADANYFLGQSYASENRDSALAYYTIVVDKYAASPRAPAALYNIGLIAEGRKETAKARDAFTRVTQAYPQSNEAELARDRLKTLGR